jgi:hypothetical protein
MPTDAVDGLWANEPYLMQLFAAGPAVRVPETLYLRWDKRAGGLTDGWRKLPLAQQYSGFRAVIESMAAVLDAAALSGAERRALQACLLAHFVPRIRSVEADHAGAPPLPVGEIHPLFADLRFPGELPALGAEVEGWARGRYATAGREA